MRTCALLAAAALWLAPFAGLATAGPPAKPAAKPATCDGDFGTSILFEDSPQEAAKKALKEEKLVLVLHVSGHFEDPALT
ncbi:hypothetical protein AYO44_17875 [Planctomycetaceae bacterium SCGC AG-212-F19]|nr:hypothetical protein AYO44_17875 [Planctomycetaceae bacterium SCGC AG-212-F19]